MTERHRLRSLLWIAYMNGVVPMRTQPLYLLSIIASPLSFLFFVTVASHGVLLFYGIAGGMILTVLSVGTSLQTDMSHYRTDLKFQDVMVASPVEAPVYVAGIALSELIYSLPGLGVFVVLWRLNGPIGLDAALSVVGILITVWALATALGFTLATYFTDIRETFVFSSVISLGLSVLPPVYYPISAIPASVRWLAYASPTTYAAFLMQGAFGLQPLPLSSALVDWSVLVVAALVLLGIAALKARWRDP
ncbi:MAG: ABC transporter permease [Thermoplasmata archaeon]|jgi:ABC-2 type transport system permease protein|nr:ABC transporter permease [Thermoplasmata archaeon]